MSCEKRPLYLITDFFPYGTGETFVMTELEQLCRWFNITVVPRYAGKGGPRALPEGAKLLNAARRARFGEKVKFALTFFFSRQGRAEIAAVWRSGGQRLRRLTKSLLSWASAELFWTAFRESGAAANSRGSVYYSFWYTPAAVALSFHRDELPGAKIIARTNGYDLYNERATAGRQPFKPAADAGLNMIVSSCRYGQDYYLNTYGRSPGVKHVYSALGSVSNGMLASGGEGKFHLISCSNAVPVKRIERIIRGLALLEGVPVRWTHIGDGEMLPELQAMAEQCLRNRPNVQWRFAGTLSHEEVLQFYSREPVDCFITTSASEGGCPVSIQEAMSFGVPVIGTAVGGITEMLADSGNILLTPAPDSGEVAAALKTMYNMPEPQKTSLRQFNRQRWEERYDGEKNARALAEQINRLWEEK